MDNPELLIIYMCLAGGTYPEHSLSSILVLESLPNKGTTVWKEEYGDVGPEVPELEKQLFEDEHIMRIGQHKEALEIEVAVEGPEKVHPIRQVG